MSKREKRIIWELLRGGSDYENLQKLTSLTDESDSEFKEFYGFTKEDACKALRKLFINVRPLE